jgi:hypothetical protein
VKFCLEIDHINISIIFMLKVANMATLLIFVVLLDSFDIVRICTMEIMHGDN